VCTLAIFFKEFDGCPLLVAANRDERYDRPSLPPALLAGEPKIVAGKDLTGGGTWLGVNQHGLVVGILNRRIDEPAKAQPQLRSRGLLCLDLLRLRTGREAADFLRCHKERYNPFTVVYVDPESGGVAFNTAAEIQLRSLAPGLHVFSSAAEMESGSGKADRAFRLFRARAAEIAPGRGAWLASLQSVLADHTTPDRERPRDSVCVHGDGSGTVSSSIIIFAAGPQPRFENYFCAGPPCRNAFGVPVDLEVA
jgi:uncharacterized protein with NRDE domain